LLSSAFNTDRKALRNSLGEIIFMVDTAVVSRDECSG
jgi:hypothetical protein